MNKWMFVSLKLVMGYLSLVLLLPAAISAQNPSVETYDQLVQAIRKTRSETRARIEDAVRAEKVREAWVIGRLIEEHVLHHQERAEYGAQVLERLAGDLEMSRTELSYMLQFGRAHPIFPAPEKLSWSHYRELLSVNDAEEREALSQKAVEQNWSHRDLRAEIKKILSESSSEPEMLHATPGQVGVYKVIRAESGPYKGQWMIDLGFSSYVPLDEESTQIESGSETLILINPQIRVVPRTNPRQIRVTYTDTTPRGKMEDLYTYVAHVINVIDGDTFKAVIDLGFGITTVQTLRLRGLDAPEIESAEGRESKVFLESLLGFSQEAVSSNLAPIIIRTTHSDKYDRYLVDVWVEDAYINQRLIEEGHAVIVE